MNETWRTVPEYPAYEVSDLGRVRRCEPGERQARVGYIMKLTCGSGGYYVVGLMRDHKARQCRINRLIAITFLGDPPTPRHQAAHNDGNKANNVLSNIRWATPAENVADLVAHGTRLSGEKNHRAKQSVDSVRTIRSLRSSGLTYRAISASLGIPLSTVKHTGSGRRWGTVA